MEKVGIISRLIGKRPKKGGTDLEVALDAIVSLEVKYAAATAAADAAKGRLQQALEADILSGEDGDHGALETALATAKAKVDAATRLVHEARKEAAALITAGIPQRKIRIDELNAEIKKIQQAQTRRRVEAVAALCSQWALEVRKRPVEHQAGSIDFPAIGEMSRSELDGFFAKASEKPPVADPDEKALAAIRAELESQKIMDFYDTSTALDGLLALARRASA